MCFTLRPSMGHGSIKWHDGLVSWPGVFSNAVISRRPTILKRVSVTIWKGTTPTTPIRIGGPLQANRWSGPPLLVQRVASAVKGGRGVARGRNALNGLSIDLQKMNWKCRTGVHEQTGVSLQR